MPVPFKELADDESAFNSFQKTDFRMQQSGDGLRRVSPPSDQVHKLFVLVTEEHRVVEMELADVQPEEDRQADRFRAEDGAESPHLGMVLVVHVDVYFWHESPSARRIFVQQMPQKYRQADSPSPSPFFETVTSMASSISANGSF